MREVCEFIRAMLLPVGEAFDCGDDGLLVKKFFF